MKKELLKQILLDQQKIFRRKEYLIDREIDLNKYIGSDEIIIITGIRRCGKSSLLKIISKKINKKHIWINFDDIRFNDFNINNFSDIEEIVYELYGTEEIVYFLDEVQNIKSWEKWTNNLFSKKIKVFVTGSNSKLLSKELSTYLTGRNKTISLHPFSFQEYLKYKKITISKDTTIDKINILKNFKKYLKEGGFPQIIKNNDLELSKQYFQDIIQKDILVRHKIRKQKELNDLVLYLISNIGKIYSYRTLKNLTQIESLSQIKNYLEYLKDTYLFYTISRFDYSVKKQIQASQKIYVSDNSFLESVSFKFSKELGTKLENLVFLALLKKNKQIYYYNEKQECDFLIKDGLKISEAIQVSVYLENERTKEREINGLLEAMEKFNLKKGLILTMEEEEEIKIKNKIIKIMPVWKWMLE